MVKWYIIGYFGFGLILDVICRTYEAMHPDPFHIPGSMGYLFFLLWPICLIAMGIMYVSKGLDKLSEYLARKIKERSEHEQTKN